MKQVCLLCERTALDNNLYCQEIYCPAEKSPNILDYGEWIGDIEIIKPITILRAPYSMQPGISNARSCSKLPIPVNRTRRD